MTLDDIDLGGLVISDALNFTGVKSETAKTLSGGLVIWEQAEYNKVITLIGGDNWGCLQYSVLSEIINLAKIPNGRYNLNTGNEIIEVRFMNESPPAIDGKPIVNVPKPSATDWYQNITIKLMEIS